MAVRRSQESGTHRRTPLGLPLSKATANSERLADVQVTAALAKLFADGYSYGALIEFPWLYSALGVVDPRSINGGYDDWQRARFEWLTIFDLFSKRLLVLHNMALDSVPGDGYRIVLPTEQARWALREASDDIGKALAKLSSRINHTDMSGFSFAEKQEHDRARDHAADIRRWYTRELRKPTKRWDT